MEGDAYCMAWSGPRLENRYPHPRERTVALVHYPPYEERHSMLPQCERRSCMRTQQALKNGEICANALEASINSIMKM